mmetsp:Transcript_140699/g.244976  ORF Transcript_140699/g.244976 Transcript_140699/m.244976 type:complete len:100 (-) Transcript_140699:109-408(-)
MLHARHAAMKVTSASRATSNRARTTPISSVGMLARAVQGINAQVAQILQKDVTDSDSVSLIIITIMVIILVIVLVIITMMMTMIFRYMILLSNELWLRL